MTLATQRHTAIARPLKVLVPLIKEELVEGDAAGLEHYRRAGVMLIEAREQLVGARWTTWLSKNFELSRMTAWRYMKLAEEIGKGDGRITRDTTLREVSHGHREYPGERAWKNVVASAGRVNVDHVKQQRQTREEEVEIRRKLALELIGLGYKALATRLHPDRGGSRDAMARLNAVRVELKDIAATRRFV